MPSPEREATQVAKQADGSFDWDLWQVEYDRRLAERQQQLLGDARASYRAMGGWGTVKDQADWEQIVEQARDDYDRGAFLVDRLGAERHLDPPLMAVLLGLRRRLIDEHGATTAAELMLIDSAVLAYYHQLRVNGWIGDLAVWLEREFFRMDGLTAKLRDRHGSGAGEIRGLKAEDLVAQLVERLMPLLDRSNRMLIRNLKMLKTMREDRPRA